MYTDNRNLGDLDGFFNFSIPHFSFPHISLPFAKPHFIAQLQRSATRAGDSIGRATSKVVQKAAPLMPILKFTPLAPWAIAGIALAQRLDAMRLQRKQMRADDAQAAALDAQIAAQQAEYDKGMAAQQSATVPQYNYHIQPYSSRRAPQSVALPPLSFAPQSYGQQSFAPQSYGQQSFTAGATQGAQKLFGVDKKTLMMAGGATLAAVVLVQFINRR